MENNHTLSQSSHVSVMAYEYPFFSQFGHKWGMAFAIRL